MAVRSQTATTEPSTLAGLAAPHWSPSGRDQVLGDGSAAIFTRRVCNDGFPVRDANREEWLTSIAIHGPDACRVIEIVDAACGGGFVRASC